jgi:hypothetical protein
MPWSGSGLMMATQVDQWDPSALAIDLTAEDGKLALWTSAVTPNFATDTAYNASPWNSGQSSGAGYTAGGPLATGSTLTVTSGVAKYDLDNIELTETTLVSEGGLIYFPNKSNRALLAVWWGEELETQDGTFLVTWHSDGVARFTN